MNSDLLTNILRKHGSALRLFAAQWCASPDDVVQEALIDLATTAPPPETPIPWMFRVVRNKAISQSRAEQRRKRRETAVGRQPTNWFRADTSHSIDPQACVEALKRLEEVDRAVVVARVWGGLTFQQIAEICDLTLPTTHRRFQKALDFLREHVDGDKQHPIADSVSPLSGRSK